MRLCPFCTHSTTSPFGRRGDALFLRCRDCNSIFRDLTPDAFREISASAFCDTEFLDVVVSDLRREPNRSTWQSIAPLIPDGPLLEIGPGSGHLLAAAAESGRPVSGVESSLVHRDFIKSQWGIDDVHASFDDLGNRRFRSAVLINMFEHVYEPVSLLRTLRQHLTNDGVIFISTVNAECITATLTRTMWAMFKVADHVSFPSRQGMRRVATAAGFVPESVWTGELPLETPIGIATALRDLVWERHQRTADVRERSVHSCDRLPRAPLSRRIARTAMRYGSRVDPTHRLFGRLGVAATVKAVLRPLLHPAGVECGA